MTTFRAWLRSYDKAWEKYYYIEDKWICDLSFTYQRRMV